MPTPFWGQLLFGRENNEYVLVGKPQTSHSGYLCLLVRQKLAESAVPIKVMPTNNPSVAIRLTLSMKDLQHCISSRHENDASDPKREVNVIIASSHLAPSRGNEKARLRQMYELVKMCVHKADIKQTLPDSFIFVGDMNMREEEDEGFETKTMVPLVDAWKEYGGDGDTYFTWDTYTNLYWPSGRKFRCRFDRVYCHTAAKSDFHMRVSDFDLIGNTPLLDHGGSHHCLSDHFGIYSQFTVSPNNHHDF
jgi:hypothetical protein